MIITSIDHHSDRDNGYVSIDLSDDQSPNRILDICECFNTMTHEYEYMIKPHWPSDSFHPEMKMDEKEFLDFVEAVNRIARKIIER